MHAQLHFYACAINAHKHWLINLAQAGCKSHNYNAFDNKCTVHWLINLAQAGCKSHNYNAFDNKCTVLAYH